MNINDINRSELTLARKVIIACVKNGNSFAELQQQLRARLAATSEVHQARPTPDATEVQ